MKVLLPNWLICFSMSLCITRIAVMTTMMEKTPTNTPSRVRAERSLWAARAPMAIKKLSFTSVPRRINWKRKLFIAGGSFAAQCVHGIHPRRPEGGEEARNHPGNERDEDGQAGHRE